MEFAKRKAAALASLAATETDKSPKGTLDTPIIPLLHAINSHPSFFTTSSCSGRISILSQPPINTSSTKPRKKAQGGSWLFITHDKADPDSVIDLVFHPKTNDEPASELVFRFEPFILAVECKDLASAQSLVSTAISSGFRESGVTGAGKRVIIAIRCSIRLEVPLGNTMKIMVSPEYVRYLIDVANGKMEANRKRTDAFLEALQVGGLLRSNLAADGGNVSAVIEALACPEVQDMETEINGRDNAYSGSSGVPGYSLSLVKIHVDEPVERLFLWGHSACAYSFATHSKVMVFGGFGGIGRHTRRDNVLLIDPLSGVLQELNVEAGPSPRLGHSASMVGDCIFVIGGRAGPLEILNDTWVFDGSDFRWRRLECTGSPFPPRHRHAAAVIGSRIYVFGGLSNESIVSSFYVLDTDRKQWKELQTGGETPGARHSHSMVAFGSRIFMFGGYDGEKALGDFWTLDVQTCTWKQENTAGRSPHARFSHSMFVYKNYIGVIGGCPVGQHTQELALLDLRNHFWKQVTLNSAGDYLFVRSTATVVGSDLIMIGGGASCYAFGTKFSEPVKIQLDTLHRQLKPFENKRNPITSPFEGVQVEKKIDYEGPENGKPQSLPESPGLNSKTEISNGVHQKVKLHWLLQLEKKHAKVGKDILKRFGWLDLRRKVTSRGNGNYICFPVTENFCSVFEGEISCGRDALERNNNFYSFKPVIGEEFLLEKTSSSRALEILRACDATRLADEVGELRIAAKSPVKLLNGALSSLIKNKGISEGLLKELPTRWEKLGDIVVLPAKSFKDPIWNSVGKELWPTVAKCLNAHRLARQGEVAPTGTRDSNLEILVGDNGWVEHRENGIIYSFDATKCMFSWGNLSEKLRMANLNCKDEIVVDLFAGIGYFVLPFLVRAKAKLVYACEWNPHAIEALKHNLQANGVADRCVLHEGDNRETAPKGVADRVCLGLLPTSEDSWVTAVKALRSEGGVLHVHGNVKDSEEELWTQHVLDSIKEIARSEGHKWDVSVEHVERVKWYAPHIRHVVADVRCKKLEDGS